MARAKKLQLRGIIVGDDQSVTEYVPQDVGMRSIPQHFTNHKHKVETTTTTTIRREARERHMHRRPASEIVEMVSTEAIKLEATGEEKRRDGETAHRRHHYYCYCRAPLSYHV